MDLGFATLFQCLDVGNVLTVLALLLQERKVLMVCKHESVLAEVMEAFRALLFPFKWESCYVPRLTESMIGCVEFPGGFFLGLKDDSEEQGDDAAATGASGGSSMLVLVQQLLRDTDDVILVDLSRNLVTSASPRLPVTFKVRSLRVWPLSCIIFPHPHTWHGARTCRASRPSCARPCRRVGR